jgi:hypothetical protein
MRRILLIAAFVLLLILDLCGISWLLAIGGLAFAFAVVGHGGMWVPSVLIGLTVDATLIWLTVVVVRGLRTGPAQRSAPSR